MEKLRETVAEAGTRLWGAITDVAPGKTASAAVAGVASWWAVIKDVLASGLGMVVLLGSAFIVVNHVINILVRRYCPARRARVDFNKPIEAAVHCERCFACGRWICSYNLSEKGD